MSIQPRRSVLYTPGANARALAKAATLAADVVILDLEDSVAPEAKALARAQVSEAVKGSGFGAREVVIRVNAAGSPWGEADLLAAIEAGPDAILLPKVEGPAAIMAAARALREGGAPDKTRIWAMMETPSAILAAQAIAASAADPSSRLAALVMGLNDLAKETRARLTPGRPALTPWIAACTLAARIHGLDLIDGVYNDLGDARGFREECLQGRDLGLDGKTLIHPSQIDACNEVFAPAEDEVEAARAIIAAFAAPENAGKGVIALNGRMVELLHAEMARRTLALVEAIAARG